MNPQIVTIANAFYVVAGLIGVPSSIAAVFYGVFRVRLAMTPAAAPPMSVQNPDAILLILQGMSRALSFTANVFGGLSQIVFNFIAAIAAVMLVLAIGLYVTGRGLHAHQEWARVIGGGLMIGVVLSGLLALLTFRGPVQLVSLALIGGSVYALTGLWRGYSVALAG